ncbi:hypothetical protein AAFF_G00204180 [Aldrovandia affinis]|uniref:Uncharacterized protein n=1 Tax=Aldrovandia affinis TaxID=143900 RepID=A0AAD7RHN0_9TELE|nr:hypothetical protein AAFF_G00204180 [Aldrovandia affinis]
MLAAIPAISNYFKPAAVDVRTASQLDSEFISQAVASSSATLVAVNEEDGTEVDANDKEGSSNDRGRDRETEEDDSLDSIREDEVKAEQPEVQSGESQQEPKEELETSPSPTLPCGVMHLATA